MGSKSNVMVLADSLHHDDMRNISTNFGWSNTSTFWSENIVLLLAQIIHKCTPPPLRETTQKLLEGGGGGDFFFLFLALIFTRKKICADENPSPRPSINLVTLQNRQK